jgi:hypothetical protein
MINEVPIMNDYALRALETCFKLHKELLEDECFAGYEGSKVDFDNLYHEVYIIVRDELPDDADVEQIAETFYDYQFEIVNGDRDAGWYL